MASNWLSFSLSFLLVLHGTFAQQRYQQQQGECQLNRLSPQEPTVRIQAEAGVTELWDPNNQQFQCAGVSLIRHVIQSRGMLLPSYVNTPLLAYVERGRGFYGIMQSGCPETFQSSQQMQQGERGAGSRFQDRHQRIGQFRQGDIIAFPAGAAHWVYNEGNEELVLVVLEDSSNNANQLGRTSRRFFIAGNPQQGQQQQQQGQYGGRSLRREQFQSGNVFNGFDVQVLAEAFGVDQETARRLQGQEDQRGHIVNIQQGLRVVRPPFSQEQEEREERQEQGQYGPRMNGIEETICSAKVRQNIDNPSRADIYNPHAGRFTTVNSLTLPILSFLRLSAARGVLYRDSIMAPHWVTNAHKVIYITKGESRIQIVDHRGQAVLDDRVRQGQVVVVPQNYAVVKHAETEGCEWVEFNTNDNAMINTLSGRTSAIRGLPVDVIANSYQISRDEARRLKFNREETLIFRSSGRARSSERVAAA
ncbi:11S globulin seed storage protein Jug r 4 [Nicotiana tabacum]|uniref:11S globulin seed storage protein Jug r 4 n=1 Tax=Nicotiana tabacum TaxID=4097 RepID=A0A1S3YS97_TOBAC|nr:11S globulin seed storage protein Jug r 4-like [Nicotiana tomentosiformis]XP_016455081.1 PREDICTED: legumin A-like [Nicotiana tabacum]